MDLYSWKYTDVMFLRVDVLHGLRVASLVSSVLPHSAFLCWIQGNAAVPVRQIRHVTTCRLIFLSMNHSCPGSSNWQKRYQKKESRSVDDTGSTIIIFIVWKHYNLEFIHFILIFNCYFTDFHREVRNSRKVWMWPYEWKLCCHFCICTSSYQTSSILHWYGA